MKQRSIFSDTLWISISVVISSLAALVFILFLKKWDDSYVAFMGVVNILSTIILAFFRFGIFGFILTKFPKSTSNEKEYSEAKKMVKTGLLFLCLVIGIVTVVLIIFKQFLSDFFLETTSLVSYFNLGLLIVAFFSLDAYGASLLNIQKLNTMRGILRSLQTLLRNLLPIPFILMRNFELVLWAILIPDILFFLTTVIISRKIIFVKGWYSLSKFLKNSFPIYLTEMFNYGQTRIDTLLVNIFLDEQTFSNYYIIRLFFNVLQNLAIAINNSFLPHMSGMYKISDDDNKLFYRFFNNITRVVTFLIFIIFVVSLPISIILLRLNTIPVTTTILVTIGLMFYSIVPRILSLQVLGVYYASVRLKIIPLLNLIYMAFNVGISALFIYLFELSGVGLSILVGTFFGYGIFYIYIRKYEKIEINTKSLLLQSIIALFTIVPTILFFAFGIRSWIIMGIIALIQGLIFIIISVNYLQEEISAFLTLLPKKAQKIVGNVLQKLVIFKKKEIRFDHV